MTDFREDDELKTDTDRPAREYEIGEMSAEGAVEQTEKREESAESAERPAEEPGRLADELERASVRPQEADQRAESASGLPQEADRRAAQASDRPQEADRRAAQVSVQSQEADFRSEPYTEPAAGQPKSPGERPAYKEVPASRRSAEGRGRSRARQNRKKAGAPQSGAQYPSAPEQSSEQSNESTYGHRGAAPEPDTNYAYGRGETAPERISVNGSPAERIPSEGTAASPSSVASGASGKRQMGNKKKIGLAAGVLAAAVLVCGGLYFALARQYKGVFFPNTTINGVDASGKSVEEVQALIAAGIDGYVLTIKERGGKAEQITGDDIGLRSVFDGSLEELLAAQNPNEWLKYKFRPSEYEIETMIAYDEELLKKAVDGLDCMDPERMEKPENARLSDYGGSPQGYAIIPETEGTTVLPEKVKKGIADAIMNLRQTLSLEESGSYAAPEITKEDGALKQLLETMNRYAGVTVTYMFGDKTAVLGGDRTHGWLKVNADNSVTVDADRAAEFVAELAAQYNTSNRAKTLKTSYGPTIKISGGTYGWRINQAEETALLIQNILSGESQSREPVYAQRANSFGENDYGDTYVEINLTAQHLFYYKDGVKIAESDFVSGNLSKGWGTPAGSYPLNYKERNAVLKGETYRTPVDYWMPFNGGIGMHDATWRSSFGGTLYKTGGSHGCINLPHSIAKKIYENISPGTPVLCYNLSGTEKPGTSSTKPPETTAAPTQPAEIPTQPPAETPAATQPQGPGSSTGGGPAGPAPAETAAQPTQPAVLPTQPSVLPTQPADLPAQTPTQAPAGPGSDTGGGGSGPGAA